jgi:hypothetical protein
MPACRRIAAACSNPDIDTASRGRTRSNRAIARHFHQRSGRTRELSTLGEASCWEYLTTSKGLLSLATAGSWGGTGGWRTKRSQCAAYAVCTFRQPFVWDSRGALGAINYCFTLGSAKCPGSQTSPNHPM